jgi:hypothetical protein
MARWRELVFFTRFLVAFKALEASERQRVLQDGWAFAHWIQSIPEAESRQPRHMLLYLLFPDSFEISDTFPSPAHAEGYWLAASGAIKIYCATDSSR